MELKPITHFFNKKIYCVPSYQRGYSWEEKQITDLLTDIHHAIKLDSLHYTGTITIHSQNTAEKIGLNNYEIFHIVDGQQRITTLILILSYILKELKDNPETSGDAAEKESTYIVCKGSYLFRYSIDKVSENYFRSLILENENLSSLEENLYTRNLQNAKKVIKKYFEQPDNKERLIDFLSAIEEKLQFNEYIISNTTEIGIVFETMNNRGVGLSNLEIVKNRLLYLTSKIKTDEEGKSRLVNLSNEINNKWSIILKNLTLPKKVLDEDTFLNNHWIIYYGWNKDNQAKKEILDEFFSITKMVDNPEKMISSIEEYINSLATTSLHWRFLNYPEEENAFIEVEDSKLRSRIKYVASKLNRLSNSTIRPLIMAFMPLMKSDPAKLLEFIETAEIFSFRLFSMNRRRSDTGKGDIFRSCNRFHTNATKPKIQKEALRYLAWYIDTYGDEDRFQLEVEELFKSTKKLGFYSWNGLTYFLFEYEESLKGKEDQKVEYKFANVRAKSVEHILPQTIGKTPWREVVKGIRKNQLKPHVHSLGNLVLISAPKNSELRNSEFSIKRKGYQSGSFSEIEIANSNRSWSINKIKKREKDLLKFMKDRWRIDEEFTQIYGNGEEENLIEDTYEEEIELIDEMNTEENNA